MNTPHSHHLTRLGAFALKMPGSWAWGLVLKLNLAVAPCRNPEHLPKARPPFGAVR